MDTAIQGTLGLVLSVFIEATSLFRGDLAVLVPSVSSEWTLHSTMNGRFPSSPRPLIKTRLSAQPLIWK